MAQALLTVTRAPAAMLGIQERKGTLNPGSDAEFVIYTEEQHDGVPKLVVDEVWKFGKCVYERERNLE